jgi:hypothetical protein
MPRHAHGEVTADRTAATGSPRSTSTSTFPAPRPSEQEAGELFAKAERDCFVGASLTPAPTYTWNVVE